jgi:hypothetical protein
MADDLLVAQTKSAIVLGRRRRNRDTQRWCGLHQYVCTPGPPTQAIIEFIQSAAPGRAAG